MIAQAAKRHGIFYGWIITVCAFLLVFVSVGLFVICWSIFTIPVCESLGISRQKYSNFITFTLFGQMTAAIYLPKLISRFGERRCMKAASVLLPCAVVCLSFVKNTFQLIAIAPFIGFLVPPISFLMLSILLSNWFYKYRGTVIGISFMSSGFSTMLLSPIITSLIASVGWRATFQLMAALCAVIAIPICHIFIIERPEDIGLFPDGADAPPVTAAGVSENSWGFTRTQMLKTPAFWLFLMFVLGNALVLLCYSSAIPYLCDIGYDAATAAKVYSLCMAGLAIFRTSGGFIADKVGLYRVTFTFAVLVPLLTIGLIFAEYIHFEAVLIALGFGVGNVVSGIYYSLICGDLFGRKHFAQAYGTISAFGSFSSACCPMISGAMYTAYGSYMPAYVVFTVIYVIGFFCLCASVSMQKRWKRNNGLI